MYRFFHYSYPLFAIAALLLNCQQAICQEKVEKAPDEFQPTVGRDPFFGKRDRQILSTSANLSLRYPHVCGPPV